MVFVVFAALIVGTLGNPTVAADDETQCLHAGVRGGPLIRDPTELVQLFVDEKGAIAFEVPTFVVKNTHEQYYVWGVASCAGGAVQKIIDCVQGAVDLLGIEECVP